MNESVEKMDGVFIVEWEGGGCGDVLMAKRKFLQHEFPLRKPFACRCASLFSGAPIRAARRRATPSFF